MARFCLWADVLVLAITQQAHRGIFAGEELIKACGKVRNMAEENVKKKKLRLGGLIVFLCFVVSIASVIISVYMYKMVNDRLPIDSSELAMEITEQIVLQQDAEYDALRNAALRLENAAAATATEERSANQIINEYLINSSHAKRHDLNMNNIKEKGQFKYYTSSGEKISKAGIDVSYYQGNIDWEKVAATGEVDFAIIRLGFRGYGQAGKLVLDQYFERNIKGASEAGLKVGVYFFTQAINEEEAVEEARFVIDNLRDYKLDYPVYIDTEQISDDSARTNKANLSQKELSKICIAFCDEIEKAGYRSGIYANKSWFLRKLDLEMLDDYEKWFAFYNDSNDWPFAQDVWQFGCEGKIDGIKGDVDLNIEFKDSQHTE